MSFTPNIGPARRAIYGVFGLALIGLAWWGVVQNTGVAIVLALAGAVTALEGAAGF